MEHKKIELPLEILEQLFPCDDLDGGNVIPTRAATSQAADSLNVPWEEIRWVAPDVFEIRYGSSWIATAFSKDGRRVRFHSNNAGDFRESDAAPFEDSLDD